MVLNQLIEPPPENHVVPHMCHLGCGHRFNTYVNYMAHAQVTRYGKVGDNRSCHLYEAVPHTERSLHQGTIFHLVDEYIIGTMIRTIQKRDVSWGSVRPGIDTGCYTSGHSLLQKHPLQAQWLIKAKSILTWGKEKIRSEKAPRSCSQMTFLV